MKVWMPDLLIQSEVDEELRRFVSNLWSLNERNVCCFVTDILNKKAGLSQDKQVTDICTSPTAPTSSFYYNTDDITACLLPL